MPLAFSGCWPAARRAAILGRTYLGQWDKPLEKDDTKSYTIIGRSEVDVVEIDLSVQSNNYNCCSLIPADADRLFLAFSPQQRALGGSSYPVEPFPSARFLASSMIGAPEIGLYRA